MSVVFVMYVELFIDSSSPLWPGGRDRTLVIRFGRFASYGSSGNHVFSLTGAVLDFWAECCTYLADGFLLSSFGHTFDDKCRQRAMNYRDASTDDAQVWFYDTPFDDNHSIVWIWLVFLSGREPWANLHVTSGLMDAFRYVARKQLTTRTLGEVRLGLVRKDRLLLTKNPIQTEEPIQACFLLTCAASESRASEERELKRRLLSKTQRLLSMFWQHQCNVPEGLCNTLYQSDGTGRPTNKIMIQFRMWPPSRSAHNNKRGTIFAWRFVDTGEELRFWWDWGWFCKMFGCTNNTKDC